ncbi:hypothetical protein C8R42DRAFT_753151 [Lentinula raphanica]|nr:hypothetical protein C8R42DRAFT_753151 [Lentinula raphanica]
MPKDREGKGDEERGERGKLWSSLLESTTKAHTTSDFVVVVLGVDRHRLHLTTHISNETKTKWIYVFVLPGPKFSYEEEDGNRTRACVRALGVHHDFTPRTLNETIWRTEGWRAWASETRLRLRPNAFWISSYLPPGATQNPLIRKDSGILGEEQIEMGANSNDRGWTEKKGREGSSSWAHTTIILRDRARSPSPPSPPSLHLSLHPSRPPSFIPDPTATLHSTESYA